MRLKGAIFDADGTLLNSMHIWQELGTRYLESIHIQPEERLSRILYPMSLEQGCAYLKKHYGLKHSHDGIMRGILGIIEEFYRHEVMLKTGVKVLLEGMKDRNIPMVIATSGDRNLLMSALERNNIASCFAAVFTCSELGTTKHEAKIFLECAEFMGLQPENIGVFEDALFAIETAKRAGFITFGVEDASAVHDRERIREVSDYYITDFTGGFRE